MEFKERSSFKVSFVTLGLLLVLIVPVIYLGVKGKLSSPAKVSVPAQTMALAERINLSNVSPSYDSFFQLGFAYQQRKLFKEAVSAYEKAISYNSKSALAYNNLGVAYGELGLWNKQVDACRKALEIDPNYQLARNNLAWAEQQLKGK